MDGPAMQSDADRGAARWFKIADATSLQHATCERVLAAAALAIEHRGEFLIVLAGGDTPRATYRALRTGVTDWSRWHVYFGDERCLPSGDAQRNSTMALDTLLYQVPIPADQVHVIAGERGADKAAAAYEALLQGIGEFDLVILGLGEDGHTASLFPGADWGDRSNAPDVLAVLDAPKPPRQRVSLSAHRLSRTREALFLVAGVSKVGAVTRWRAGDRIPAASIRPEGGVDVFVESTALSASER